MNTVRHRLMCRESERRLASAQALRAAADASDSAYLLELLAFELLLKVVFEKTTSSLAPMHHYYEKIFDALPQNTQGDVIRLAGKRVGPSALTSNASGVLRHLGSNFVQLRYPFHRYSQMTELEYEQVGTKWLANGANESDAHFRYYPEELLGLTVALQTLAANNSFKPEPLGGSA